MQLTGEHSSSQNMWFHIIPWHHHRTDQTKCCHMYQPLPVTQRKVHTGKNVSFSIWNQSFRLPRLIHLLIISWVPCNFHNCSTLQFLAISLSNYRPHTTAYLPNPHGNSRNSLNKIKYDQSVHSIHCNRLQHEGAYFNILCNVSKLL